MLSFETSSAHIAEKLGFKSYMHSKIGKNNFFVLFFIALGGLLMCLYADYMVLSQFLSTRNTAWLIGASPFFIITLIPLIYLVVLIVKRNSRSASNKEFGSLSERNGRLFLAYVAACKDWCYRDRDSNTTTHNHVYLLIAFIDGNYHYLSTDVLSGESDCSKGDFTVIRYISDMDFTISSSDTAAEVAYTSREIDVVPPVVSLEEGLQAIQDAAVNKHRGTIQSRLDYVRSHPLYTPK